MYWIIAKFLTTDNAKSLRLKMSAEPLNLHLRTVEMTLKTSHIHKFVKSIAAFCRAHIHAYTFSPNGLEKS